MDADMRVLIIEARYYEDISNALLDGAMDALKKYQGLEIITITVPGALEIPHVISIAEKEAAGYDGYIALGCVIRGETTHYDYECTESARALMDLAIGNQLAIGNGIITVENSDQAWARADLNRKNKGGFAAETVLRMISIKDEMKANNV
ncbi:MAG: 6,7-dimethyl-8-ribityllumazine synthase [Hellea sp.]|nr:6,7-dimethyl-8-ribityllumazine synthase [Hellea sp.]